jgi:hypothetical protein
MSDGSLCFSNYLALVDEITDVLPSYYVIHLFMTANCDWNKPDLI